MVLPNITNPGTDEHGHDGHGTKDKVARRKMSLLDLASDLSNVSRAGKVMGYSRQQFYEIRRNFQTYGAEGLIDRLPGAKGPHPKRLPAEIEAAVAVLHNDVPPFYRNMGKRPIETVMSLVSQEG